jgi:hypothetical protein
MGFISTLKKLFLTDSSKSSISNHQEGKSKMEAKNYTEAQEAEMLAAGLIDNDMALEFAERFGKDVRSVRAKAVRMGIYKAKEKTSKSGGKIESKEQIVKEIASMVGANLDGLEKASKQALIAIRAKLAA